MTKHTLTPESITAAKALVSRLCKNGLVRMSVPVDFARDEDMLICALIDVAEKSLLTPTPAASGALPADALDALRNYTQADADGVMVTVSREALEMALAALASREAGTATLTDEQIIKAVSPHLFFNDSPDGDNSTDDVLKAARALLALASPQVAPGLSLNTPLESECSTISGFFSDVMTAAGLVEHGKQCKSLAVRMSKACMELRGLVYGATPAQVAPTAAAEEPLKWRCFHCEEVFTTRDSAREHFGSSEMQSPACQIDIAEYREMEARMRSYNDEDAEIHRAMYRMQGDHATALLREEEKGYARGLEGAKKYPQELGLQPIATAAPAPVAPQDDARDAAEVWNEAIEAAARRIEGGSFLHDQAPAKLFANQLAPVIRSMKRTPAAKPTEERS